MNHAATPGHTARYSSTEQHAAPGSTQHIVTHGGLLNAMTIPPVPLQHSPKFSDSHPWTSLICPYHFCCCFVSQGCAKQPDIFDQDSLISPHFYPVLPGSTIFYHFFSLRFYQFTWHFKQYQADAVSRSPGWSWQNLKEKMGALNIQYIIFWLILTHFSVISDLKNSQNLHFHQFSPDLFGGNQGQPQPVFHLPSRATRMRAWTFA